VAPGIGCWYTPVKMSYENGPYRYPSPPVSGRPRDNLQATRAYLRGPSGCDAIHVVHGRDIDGVGRRRDIETPGAGNRRNNGRSAVRGDSHHHTGLCGDTDLQKIDRALGPDFPDRIAPRPDRRTAWTRTPGCQPVIREAEQSARQFFDASARNTVAPAGRMRLTGLANGIRITNAPSVV
jgi:hypothetical protein